MLHVVFVGRFDLVLLKRYYACFPVCVKLLVVLHACDVDGLEVDGVVLSIFLWRPRVGVQTLLADVLPRLRSFGLTFIVMNF